MDNNFKHSMESLIAGIPLFSNLSPEELQRIAQPARKLRARKGEILFHTDDPCHGFFLIVSGKVKLAFHSSAGNEKVVEILCAGQTFGEAVMFMDKPYPLSAQTLADSTLIYITKQAVFQALENNPVLCRKLITGLAIRLHQLVQNQEFSSLRSGKQRLADYLLRLIPVAEADQRMPQVTLPANKGTIASHLGITPEHFSRTLHDMTEAGLIAVSGKCIHIHDRQQLRQAVDHNQCGSLHAD